MVRNAAIQALAVHVERIHDDRVWARLRRVLGLLRRCGSYATLFVYPFRAIVAGYGDLAFERVKRLCEEGHEIGQHTHFYMGKAIDKPSKVTDLSIENIRQCLERDYQWLARIIPPRGFVSGSWAIPDALYPSLAELGFEYDCSVLHPRMKEKDYPYTRCLEKPEVCSFGERALLLLPTTHTLKMFCIDKWGSLNAPTKGIRYQLVYFHDYDLLRWSIYAAALWISTFTGIWVTCGEVAAALLNSGGQFDES